MKSKSQVRIFLKIPARQNHNVCKRAGPVVQTTREQAGSNGSALIFASPMISSPVLGARTVRRAFDNA